MDRFPLLIPHSEEPAGMLTVYNPFNLTPIAEVPTCDSRHIDRALTTAQALFQNKDNWLPLDQRMAIFTKLIELVTDEQESLIQTAVEEGGKPLVDSRIEVSRAIEGLQLCLDCMRSDSGSVPTINTSAATRHHFAFTAREPVGVVAAISAFNHPLNLIVHQVGPALAAGCPVIIKPSEETPLSCLRLAKLFYEAGLPEEWLQVAVTESIPVAEHLVTSARINFLSFIGSAKVGWMLRSKVAPGTRCALEHGGVAPVIIAEDADLDLCVKQLTKSAFYHAGQVCVSTQRIFVHTHIGHAFMTAFTAAANQLTVDDPRHEKTDVGPLIRPSEVDRVEAWVNEARGMGATILCDGQRISQTCYAPTIVYNPSPDCQLSQQEVFGPVVCVYDYDHLDNAIDQANSLPFAFQAAVFSKRQDTILRAYKRLNASTVMANQHTAFRTDGMPFAGLRQSGLGTGGIPHTFKDMQVEKMLVINSPEL